MSRGFRWALGIVIVATVAGIASGIRSQTGTGGVWLEVGRELKLLSGDPENTERALAWEIPRLGANRRVMIGGRQPADLGLTPDSGSQRMGRPRFVVLTLVNGTAAGASRLVVADAGADLAALTARYPDRDRYLLVPATIARWKGGPDGTSFFLSMASTQLHLPTERPLGRELLVRAGRGGIPFIAGSRP